MAHVIVQVTQKTFDLFMMISIFYLNIAQATAE